MPLWKGLLAYETFPLVRIARSKTGCRTPWSLLVGMASLERQFALRQRTRSLPASVRLLTGLTLGQILVVPFRKVLLALFKDMARAESVRRALVLDLIQPE